MPHFVSEAAAVRRGAAPTGSAAAWRPPRSAAALRASALGASLTLVALLSLLALAAFVAVYLGVPLLSFESAQAVAEQNATNGTACAHPLVAARGACRVPCASSAGCHGVCSEGACLACTRDSDCAGRTDGAHVCSEGACVRCTVNAHCNDDHHAGAQLCAEGHCVSACAEGCADDQVCREEGFCAECADSDDCGGALRPHCSAGGACVSCLTSSDCPSGSTCDHGDCYPLQSSEAPRSTSEVEPFRIRTREGGRYLQVEGDAVRFSAVAAADAQLWVLVAGSPEVLLNYSAERVLLAPGADDVVRTALHGSGGVGPYWASSGRTARILYKESWIRYRGLTEADDGGAVWGPAADSTRLVCEPVHPSALTHTVPPDALAAITDGVALHGAARHTRFDGEADEALDLFSATDCARACFSAGPAACAAWHFAEDVCSMRGTYVASEYAYDETVDGVAGRFSAAEQIAHPPHADVREVPGVRDAAQCGARAASDAHAFSWAWVPSLAGPGACYVNRTEVAGDSNMLIRPLLVHNEGSSGVLLATDFPGLVLSAKREADAGIAIESFYANYGSTDAADLWYFSLNSSDVSNWGVVAAALATIDAPYARSDGAILRQDWYTVRRRPRQTFAEALHSAFGE